MKSEQDIDAIARKYGATVSEQDMDAIARKHGGVVTGEDLTHTGPIPESQTQPPVPPSPSFLQSLTSYLPSWHTALTTGGALAGGTLGGIGSTILGTPIAGIPGAALGGAAGASIGESAYQLGQHLMGVPEAPQTGGEAAVQQAKALAGGALQEGIGAIGPKAPAMLRSSAAKNIEQAVKPSSMAAKEAIQEAAPKAVSKFPISASSTALRKDLEGLSSTANIEVNHAYAQAAQQFPNTQFSSAPIIQKLQQDLGQFYVNGQPVVGAESDIKAYKTVIDWLKANPRFSISDFRKTKQIWDKVTESHLSKYSGSPTADPAMAEALMRASNTVRDTIHTAFPSLKKADQDASMWIALSEAAKAANIRGSSIEPWKILTSRAGLAGAAGAGFEYSRGNSPVRGMAEGALLVALPQTALWDTLSAASKARLANFLEHSIVQSGLKVGTVAGSAAAQEFVRPTKQNQGRPMTAEEYLKSINE